ncbi:hypothetical protein K7432_001074 [Basidiobolus ranarum]|uniref:Uncharacterized protein n=1 Tax=Basidiobolus ranarum TaxID=34480 RepID=A0ABR2X3X6_9FUNG
MTNPPLDTLYCYCSIIDSSLLCPICSDPFLDPVQTSCKHTFCRECITQWLFSTKTYEEENSYLYNGDRPNSPQAFKCPVCKDYSESLVLPEQDLIEDVDKLPVKCLACQITMERKHFERHYDVECQYRVLKCPYTGCSERAVRKELERHKKSCPAAKNGHGSTNENPSGTASFLRRIKFEHDPAKRASEVPSVTDSDFHEFKSGIFFEYYQGEFDQLPDFDSIVASNVGIVGNMMINESSEMNIFDKYGAERNIIDTGNFAVRFSCYVTVPHDGLYKFYTESNDGSALYIGGTKVVDHDGIHYSKEMEGKITLGAGRYQMTVTYFHKNGKIMEGFRTGPYLSVSFSYSGPYWPFAIGSIPKQVLTDNLFQYDFKDTRIRKLIKENVGGRTDKSESSLSIRQLQLQLDVANATIQSLEQVIHEMTIASDTKLQAMRRSLEEQENRTKKLVDAISSVNLYRSHGNEDVDYRESVSSLYWEYDQDQVCSTVQIFIITA